MEQLNKCPNCSGKLELSSNRTRLVCPFCGGEFKLDETTRQEVGDNPTNKDWFIYEWDYNKLKETPKCSDAVQAFVRTLNDYDSSEKIISYMRDYLMNYDEISAPGIREDKMSGIARRIAGNMSPDEKIICYTAVPYLLFGYSLGLPEIKLGETYANNISTFTSHFDLMGTVAALICMLAFEQKPDRPKIRLTSNVK